MYGGLYFKKGLMVGLKKTYLRNDKRRKSKDWFCCLTIIQNYTTATVILEQTLRLAMWRRGVVVSLLHIFIQQSLNSGSAQVQILLAVCQRFVMMRTLHVQS